MPARVNKVLLLSIVGGVLVLAVVGVIFVVMTNQGAAKRESLVQMADDYRKKGQTTQLEFVLDRMLQSDPKDSASRKELAEIRESKGQIQRAYQDYLNVLQLEPLNVPVMLKLAFYEGQSGRWGEMKRHAKSAVELQPQNAEARMRLAEACLGNGVDEYPEALENAKLAVQYAPDSLDAYLILARAHLARQQPEEARKVLAEAEKVAPKSQVLWSFVAQFHQRMGEKTEAEAAFKAALENAKNPVVAQIQLGDFYMGGREFAKAEACYKAACDNATAQSDRKFAYTSYGDYYAQRDNGPLALKQYQEALVAMPGARDILLKEGQIFLGLKQFDEARRVIDMVKSQGARDQLSVMALYLDGQRHFLEGRTDEALEQYQAALNLQKMGDIKMATTEVYMALAGVYLKKDDVSKAGEALKAAYVQAPGNPRVMMAYSRLLLAMREYDQVIGILENPAKPFEGFVTLARAYMGRGSDADLREAKVQFLKAAQIRPNDVEVHLDLARLAARQRNGAEALKEADEAIRVRPDYAEAYLTKAAVLEVTNQPKKAEEAYQASVKALPDQTRVLFAYARFLARTNRFEEADRLLLEDNAKRAADSVQRKEYLDQIPRFYLASGKTDKALEWYRAQAQADPKDSNSRQSVVLILLSRNQTEEATKVIEEIKAAEGVESPRVLKLEGQALVSARQFKEALKKLVAAAKADEKDGDVQYYLGLSYLRTGDAPKAKEILQRVRAQFPTNTRVERALAEALYTTGDFKAASDLAESLKARGETGMDLDVIINDASTRGGEAVEGEAGWRDFVAKHPERVEGWIGLEDALLRQGKVDEAAKAAEKAYEIEKGSFRTTWSLANLYLQQKAYDKAIAITTKSLETEENKNNAALLGLLARLYEVSGKPEDALAVYEKIRTLDPKNPMPYIAKAVEALGKNDLAGAEKAFREALDLRPEDAIIRQRLVEVLAAQNKFAEAHVVLDRAIQAAKPTDEAMIGLDVLKARVRLAEGNGDDAIRLYRAAIKLAHDLAMEKKYVPLHFELGQIYSRLNRLAEARTSFEAARDLEPGFIDARLALTQIAVRDSRYADARAECLRILELQPNLIALLTLGDISRAENNNAEARGYYERAAKEFPTASLPLRKRAETLAAEGRILLRTSVPDANRKIDEAVADLMKVVDLEKHSPDSVGAVTDLLVASLRYDAAIAFLQSEKDKCPEPAAVWLFMGNVEEARGNHAKGREYFDASLNLRGNSARVYLYKAQSYFADRNTAKAIDEAKQALKVSETFESAYLFLENMYRDDASPDALKALYEKWRAALPDSVVAANNQAFFLTEKLNDPNGALKVIDGYRARMASANRRFPFGEELDDTEGMAYFKKGDYRKAIELFKKSTDQRRDSARTWEHTRMAWAKMLEKAKAENDDTSAARAQVEITKAYNRVLELSPESFESLSQMGDVRLSEGKVKEAIESYEGALRIKKDADVKRKLAELLIRDKRFADAERAVSELIAEDAKEPKNRMLQAMLWSRTGKSDEALSALETLVKDTPDLYSAHYLLAMEYVERKDIEKAQKELERVTTLAPEFLGARVVKAQLLAAQNKVDEAIAEWRAVLKVDPMNFDAGYNIGSFYLAQKKLPEAETAFRDLVNRWPESAPAEEGLATTYYLQDRLSDALMEFRNARRKSPRSVDLLRGFCTVLQAQKQPDAVIREYTSFVEENPASTDAWVDLAGIYARADRMGDAERALKSAVRTNRTNPSVHSALVDFYMSRNMLPESRDAARRLMEDVGTAQGKAVGHTAIARSFEAENKLDEAVKEYRAALDADRDYLVAVNNLAWLLITRKNDIEGGIALAEPYLTKPGVAGFAELFDTVGWGYRLKENYAKAEPMLAQSMNGLRARGQFSPSIAYHYAETLYLAQKTAEAKKWLEMLQKYDFPEKDKAMEILKKIQ